MLEPNWLLVEPAADTEAFHGPGPVRALWGVGPKAAEALESRGIRLVSDILDTPRHALDQVLGAAMGERIWHLSRGIDAREVHTGRAEKSVGHEETFHADISDTRTLHVEFRRLADRVGARLRAQQYEASTISIKVRFSDFTTLSRSRTLPEPTSVGQRIGDAAIELFDTIDRRQAVRLVGVRGEKLKPATMAATLWDDDAEWRRVEGALDGAAARFGRGAVTDGWLTGPSLGVEVLPRKQRPS